MSGYGDQTYGATYYGGALDQSAHFVIEVLLNSVWTDITCDVRTLRINTGRSKLLDAFTAATMALDLANFEDQYNAWNSHGIWAQNGVFRTGVPIRVRLEQFGDAATLFTGTTDAVTDSWPGAGADALTNVQATDAFKGLARMRPVKLGTPAGAGELSGARVNRILDAAGFTDARAVSLGLSAWQGTILDGVALDLINEVGEGEFGSVYVDGTGALTFLDRNAVSTNPRMANVQWRFLDFDDNPALNDWTCYSDLKLQAADDQVINQANVTATGLTPVQIQNDATSQGWYDVRSYTKTLPLNTLADANQLALNVVQQLSYNERRVDGLTFYPLFTHNGNRVASHMRLLDRIRVVRTGKGGAQIDAELFVQGIEHEITGGGLGDTPAAWTVNITTTSADLVHDAAPWDAANWEEGVWGV
jgi:hypothetical protein